MRFRVPLRLKSTSSLALVAAASWQGVGRCLRMPDVSLVCRGNQVAGLRLRADPAGLSADFPSIGDRAGVLNGGDQASIPFSRGLDGVAVAESTPRISWKKGRFRLSKKIASGFAGGLRLFHWGSSSPESGHRVRAAGTVSRRALIPTVGPLTPLMELVASGRLKGQLQTAAREKRPAAECADQDAVDDRQLGFKDAGLLEHCGKVNVEIVPDPSFVPSPKSAVSGAARTAEFEWHVPVTASGHKYVPENLDHSEVRNQRLATFRPDGLLRRQQGLQLRDEGIRWPSTCHPGSLRESRRP